MFIADKFFFKMSEMSFYSLATGKLHKKTKHRRLKNFPAGFVGSFYRNLADNINNFLGSDFYGQIANDYNILSEDVQKCILATSDFAKGMQTNINHYVTKDRINNASFRQKLDPISKNILRRQNPFELIFEDISTCDAENPIVGSLLRELDVGKKSLASDLIKNASGPPGQNFEIEKRLNKLKDFEPINRNNNNNNNLTPPPSPPSFPPSNGFLPPPPSNFEPSPLNFQLPPSNFQPPSSNSFVNFHIPAQISSVSSKNEGLTGNLFGLQTQTLTREKEKTVKDYVQQQLDDTLYELPDSPPKLELGDGLLNSLGVEADDVLNREFVSNKELQDATLEQIKEEFNFVIKLKMHLTRIVYQRSWTFSMVVKIVILYE